MDSPMKEYQSKETAAEATAQEFLGKARILEPGETRDLSETPFDFVSVGMLILGKSFDRVSLKWPTPQMMYTSLAELLC